MEASESPNENKILEPRGIGAVYADRLAKRGYDLILVARNEARQKTLSAGLTRETGRSVTPLPADLNDKGGSREGGDHAAG